MKDIIYQCLNQNSTNIICLNDLNEALEFCETSILPKENDHFPTMLNNEFELSCNLFDKETKNQNLMEIWETFLMCQNFDRISKLTPLAVYLDVVTLTKGQVISVKKWYM